MQPHRRQPTRLPRPWDSPGKNTGVGCHFPLQCMRVKSESEVPQSCSTLGDPMDCSLPGSSIHGIFQASVLEWGAIAFSVKGEQYPPNTNLRAEISPQIEREMDGFVRAGMRRCHYRAQGVAGWPCSERARLPRPMRKCASDRLQKGVLKE